MRRLTMRQLRAHKLRFAMTGLAVVLGVAFMTGTMILTDTMSRSFDDLFATTNGKVDVIVEQPETVRASSGDGRELVPSQVLDQVRAVPGVGTAAGSIQGFAQLVKADGSVASTNGLGVTVGANWQDERVNPFDLASGSAPTGADEAVLDQGTADAEGWTAGDRFRVLTQVGPRELTLVGTATLGDLEGLPGSSLVAVDDGTAQDLFGRPDRYDGVIVAGDGDVDPSTLASRIDTALGAGAYEVVTGEADTDAQQRQFQEDLSFFDQFLMAFAYISLFVGVFIIYNTFSIVVAQRKRDMAMLRAIGASRRQVVGSVLAESGAVGVIASAVGLLGGLVMSQLLRALLAAVGLDIPSGRLVVTTGTVVTAFAVGTTVTILSALMPALRAGRVAPIAALREVHDDRSAASVGRAVAGLALTVAGSAVFVAGVVGDRTDAVSRLGLGALAVVLGVVVLGPIIARSVLAVLGRPTARVAGPTGHLAQKNARRNPRRTSATAAALMIGVALVGFITILAASTKSSVSAAVDRSMRADYVVDSGTSGVGGFEPALAQRIAAQPEAGPVSPLRSSAAVIDGSPHDVQAVDTSVIGALFDLGVTEGTIDHVGDGMVAVKDDEAATRDLSVGDTIEAAFPSGTTTILTVGAVYEDAIPGSGDGVSYLVDLTTFDANVADRFDRQIYVRVADGVDATAAHDALAAQIADHPNADLRDHAQFKDRITSEIDRMVNLVYGLLALAVVIALIGITNTLALSVHERMHEIGLLRAVGMSRRQLRSAIRLESMLIALLGTGLGVALAVAGAWGITRALVDQGITTFAVPTVPIVVIVGLATLAGVLAAVGPARRAGRLDVLDAIAAR